MGYYQYVYGLIQQALPQEDLKWTDVNYCYSRLSVVTMSVIEISIPGRHKVLGNSYSNANLVLYHEYTDVTNVLWIAKVRFSDELTGAVMSMTYPIQMNVFGIDIPDDEDKDDDKEEV